MGKWIVVMPFDVRDQMYSALRNNGIDCDISSPEPRTGAIMVACKSGDMRVDLRVSETKISIPGHGVVIPRAFTVSRRPIRPRSWSQNWADATLLREIQELLATFDEMTNQEIVRKGINPGGLPPNKESDYDCNAD